MADLAAAPAPPVKAEAPAAAAAPALQASNLRMTDMLAPAAAGGIKRSPEAALAEAERDAKQAKPEPPAAAAPPAAAPKAVPPPKPKPDPKVEAALRAKEALESEPQPGDFLLATLGSVRFTVEGTQWACEAHSLCLPAWQGRGGGIGDALTIRTLLRRVDVPVLRYLDRAAVNEQAQALHDDVRASYTVQLRKLCMDKLKAFLAQLIPRATPEPKAEVKEEKAEAAPKEEKAEAAPKEEKTAPAVPAGSGIRVGDLVWLANQNQKGNILSNSRVGRVVASVGGRSRVQLLESDPLRKVKPEAFTSTGRRLPMVETWDAIFLDSALQRLPQLDDVAWPKNGYESCDQRQGSERKPAHARVVPPDGRDAELSEVDFAAKSCASVQLLAESVCALMADDRGCPRDMKVAVSRLTATSKTGLTADLRVYLSAKQMPIPDSQLHARHVGRTGTTILHALLAAGGHASGAFAALRAAKLLRKPYCVEDYLQLATRAQDGSLPQSPTPAGLTVQLKAHQRESLAWMLAEEASEGALRHLFTPLHLTTQYHNDSCMVFYSPLLREFSFDPEAWRNRGGWLAEAMGLGKTIVTMALILSDRQQRTSPQLGRREQWRITEADRDFKTSCAARALVASKGTLVLAPVSLIGQWERELKEKAPSLTVARWHDTDRERDPNKLAEFDVVLCTYETAGWAFTNSHHRFVAKPAKPAAADAAPSAEGAVPAKARKTTQPQRATLEEIAWKRIILDECQSVKDPKVAKSKAVAALTSQIRWGLSGTPVSTSIEDLFGQCLALNLGWHLSQKYHFYHAMQESDRLGPRVLLPALMMRHTGDMRVGTEQVLTLPPKREATLLVTLSTPERAAYDAAHATMQGRWRQLADEGHAAVSKNLLLAMSFLTPVRLLCSGGSFSAADLAAKRLMADEEPAVQGRGACPACGLEPECGVASPCCGAWACYDCIADVAHRGHACAACAKAVPLAALPPRPDHADNAADAASSVLMESKLHALLAELERLRSEDPSAKSLVFSSFTASLTWLAAKLKDRGFTHATITGSMSLNQRAKALEAFQSAPPTTIFLLSLRAGAVGLNLTAASQVFLLEPCFNPAMEEQAIGRVHRMGQTRPTVVRRLIVRDSLEERIRACVERRVAGGGARFCEAESSLKVGSVAGGLREDKAALRYDELSHLFGC